MNERWPKVLSIVLLLILIPTIAVYVYQGIEINTLRSSHELTLQTLHNQTQLIAELRMELAEEPYRNFESEQALRSWVDNWMLTKLPIVIKFFDETIAIRGQLYSEYYDCDDFAEAMQRDALRDGYIIDKVLVDRDGMVYNTKVSDLGSHAGNLAMTNNAYLYVEPQTGQIVGIVRRD